MLILTKKGLFCKAGNFYIDPMGSAGQVELMQKVEEGLSENRPMLFQAPTGLGKTVGVLYPVLREALSRGQYVVYTTPKNSQHEVAEDAIERLQKVGSNIRGMTLTAKNKMCFKNEAICNPEFCEYAKDHYTKVAENKVLEQMSKKKNLTSKAFKKIAKENEVCPFQIQLDAVQLADIVVCDYNYVFAPNSALGQASAMALSPTGKPNLIMDEVHNLPSRTMDYYSPAISTSYLQQLNERAEELPSTFRSDFREVIKNCRQIIEDCKPEGCVNPCAIQPPVLKFGAQDESVRTFLYRYLNSDIEIQPNDPVIKLSFYWSQFTEMLQFISEGRPEFFTTFHPNPASVFITCCDASQMIKNSYGNYSQVIGFSATLKPFNFYSQLIGMESDMVKIAEFT